MRLVLSFSLALLLSACGTDEPTAPAEVPRPTGFSDPTDSPIVDRPFGELAMSPEPGVAGAASVVVVDYTGTLEDGTVFSEGDRVLIPLAAMLPGFALGVAGMREGETKSFEVPPELGYDEPIEGVPPGATLYYEVTLHSVRSRVE